MSIEIPLYDKTRNVVRTTIISPEDETLVKQYNWHQHEGKYAVGKINMANVRLHHLILGRPPKGMVVDHINRDTFDNRRENLRFATRAQNSQNRTPKTNTKYIGIRFDIRYQKWGATCHANERTYSLGSYTEAKDAAIAYDKAVFVLFGEYALTNGLITYAECHGLKIDDLAKTKKSGLPKNITKDRMCFRVHMEQNHKPLFKDGYFETLEEAEKYLYEMNAQLDLMKEPKQEIITRNDDGIAIITCRNLVALVDDDLWYQLSKYSWGEKTGYLCGMVDGKMMSMHRYIMLLKGHDLDDTTQIVDHINRIRHDNRYCNLRLTTTSNNSQNRIKWTGCGSKYIGVKPCKSSAWEARINKNGTCYQLGRYRTEIEAALAYNFKARELYGEGACLNQIEDTHSVTPRFKLRLKQSLRTLSSPQECATPISAPIPLPTKTTFTSQYRGVHRTQNRQKWIANICTGGKNMYLGIFSTEIEAAKAYNQKAFELLGDLAKLNNIEEDQITVAQLKPPVECLIETPSSQY